MKAESSRVLCLSVTQMHTFHYRSPSPKIFHRMRFNPTGGRFVFFNFLFYLHLQFINFAYRL